MLQLSNKAWLIEDASELPVLPDRIDILYADIETSSGHPKIDSLYPWRSEYCRLHTVAVTWDNHPEVYCVPRSLVDWFLAALRRSKAWCNQNVKYDHHVIFNDLEVDYRGELIDTLTLAKLVDSDRTYKGGYGLDALAKWLLDIDISFFYNEIRPWIEDRNGKVVNHDYGLIPLPKLADYNCNDVRVTRPIYHKLLELLPEEAKRVWDNERRLTWTLVNAERRGMRINVQNTKIANARSLSRMLRYKTAIENIIGYEFSPKSHPDCVDLLINRFGLTPIYKDESITFDKKALQEYKLQEGAPLEIIKLIQDYRHEDTMQGLFWTTYLDLNINGFLHSDNNQMVRSGRLSCKMPNNQQLNMEAREVVEPRDGYCFVVHDYKNIEYRYIVHYIKNERIIQLFHENPDMDFHQLMADDAGIERKPAKILNLAVGFGMGMKKTTADLARMLMATGMSYADARDRAIRIYGDYHRRLPELKPESKRAEMAARIRGYVKNAYGRRCHLPLQAAHKAFNRVVQSTAADEIKFRANALAAEMHKYDAHILALVHDEVLSEVPIECAEEYAVFATNILNQSDVDIRVPIRTDCGISTKNWRDAKEDGDRRKAAAA